MADVIRFGDVVFDFDIILRVKDENPEEYQKMVRGEQNTILNIGSLATPGILQQISRIVGERIALIENQIGHNDKEVQKLTKSIERHKGLIQKHIVEYREHLRGHKNCIRQDQDSKDNYVGQTEQLQRQRRGLEEMIDPTLLGQKVQEKRREQLIRQKEELEARIQQL